MVEVVVREQHELEVRRSRRPWPRELLLERRQAPRRFAGPASTSVSGSPSQQPEVDRAEERDGERGVGGLEPAALGGAIDSDRTWR